MKNPCIRNMDNVQDVKKLHDGRHWKLSGTKIVQGFPKRMIEELKNGNESWKNLTMKKVLGQGERGSLNWVCPNQDNY